MKINRYLTALAAVTLATTGANAERLLHFPMEPSQSGNLTETVNQNTISIYSRHGAESIPGAAGNALRLDGYSAYAQGAVKNLGDLTDATFSIWVAPQTYPVIEMDVPTTRKVVVAGTYDESAHQGWAFCLGYNGKYSFKSFSAGWALELEAADILPCYEWSHIVAVADGASKTITLYRNGKKVGERKTMGNLNCGSGLMTIGKDPVDQDCLYYLDTFNGLIDDIEVTDKALTEAEVNALAAAENKADLGVPAERFSGDLLRPKYHGMPDANWTNESHGMTYSNGRYHLFFQKNANGPYMTRLHWGHLSSDNLYDWREEPIAIAPAEDFDIKGCWSGCVFTDDQLTGGKPNAIYTAVDYAKATIAQASPLDDDLLKWEKAGAPIINGRPDGLSDDFRDPYFFRSGNDAYIVVGTSKDNKGAATLHKYDPASGTWSNDGKIFFSASSALSAGRFWEMPTVTEMADGKWLVTMTPLETSTGVRTLYWTGSINADGTFQPDFASYAPRDFELISRDGYGLLSPTICRHDGKTIALGIVPDKVSTADNCDWGWAHLYSFPREISLDSKGNLLQKPFEGLKGLRSEKADSYTDKTIDGTVEFTNATGRQLEFLGTFTVGNAPFGFRFFKSAKGEATVSYDPSKNRIVADFSSLPRIVNDGHVFNGVYSATLPERPAAGSEMTLNVFVDGSIVDIFVDNKWATSIRVFPTDEEANGAEAFSDAPVLATRLNAWQLHSEGGAGVDMLPFAPGAAMNEKVDVVTLTGMVLKRGVSPAEATEGLEKGIYLVGGKKIMVK
ncbi:MAG: GH32 C-terminal domain-containing protein [Muribaculaceae bacterium]|nr:GH32 C-terminal domain-containing protein [Muribaculaceae bacterium]